MRTSLGLDLVEVLVKHQLPFFHVDLDRLPRLDSAFKELHSERI